MLLWLLPGSALLSIKMIQNAVKKILKELGEDPKRAGLERTPQRVEQSLKFLTKGYSVDVEKLINGAVYYEDVEDMIVVKDVELFSMCEHPS